MARRFKKLYMAEQNNKPRLFVGSARPRSKCSQGYSLISLHTFSDLTAQSEIANVIL